MIKLTMPDGSIREESESLDGLALAKSISNSLAKKAIALKVDGEVVDLATVLDKDVAVEILTANTQDGLELLRHDAPEAAAA